jgi:hypothetical protein
VQDLNSTLNLGTRQLETASADQKPQGVPLEHLVFLTPWMRRLNSSFPNQTFVCIALYHIVFASYYVRNRSTDVVQFSTWKQHCVLVRAEARRPTSTARRTVDAWAVQADDGRGHPTIRVGKPVAGCDPTIS